MNNKYTYASIIAIIVIIALVLYFNKSKDKNAIEQTSTEQQTTNLDGATEQNTSTPEQTKTTTTKKLSYGDAIAKYPFRFQFINCSANPGQMTVKKGVAIMLDNRDKVSHTIKANGQTIKLAALDYAIIYPKLVTVGEPTTETPNMTCDGGGSGLLNVEK